MERVLLYFLFVIPYVIKAQSAVLLVITNVDASIKFDGEVVGASKAGSAFKIQSTPGEHYLEASKALNQSKGEIIKLEIEKQKILKIDFELTEDIEIVPVAEINFNIPGQVDVAAWQTSNQGQTYSYPSFYYAFEKGDEIILNISMSNQKGTNILNVSTYPDNVLQYTNNAFVELKDQTIKVVERSIYKFTLATNHAFTRNCFLKIKRKPTTSETKTFNSNVSLQRILTPIVVSEPQSFYLNGGRNALLQGGKSRVLLPVQLPQNTIEWVYRFSASRNPADIEHVKKNFKLFSEVSTVLLDLTGPSAKLGSLVIDQLTQPPGADYGEIVLLPHECGQAFENKADGEWKFYQDGSRSNFKSGNVKVTCCTQGNFFLGIKNPDSGYGLNVLVEVVAITAKDDYVMAAENLLKNEH